MTAADTAARERPLENYANKVATPGQSDVDHRADRWEARGCLWCISHLERVRKCGRVTVTADGSVGVRANGAAVGYAGLATCGSVWACPVCNARIQAVRRLEVGTAVAWALEDGGAAFGAYTLQHYYGQALDPLWRALSKCWQAVARDGSVKRTRERLGLVGTIRAAECTHGENGWHPHLHPVHLFARPVTATDVAHLHAEQFRAWSSAADRLGLVAPVEAAQHLHRVAGGQAHRELGDYFAKASYAPSVAAVGWEVTSTQTKTRTRASGSRTPWELLRGVHVDGDADALDLWHAWEGGSKGKKALTWSRGLRRAVGLDREATDEEIAAAEAGTRVDTGFLITDWEPIRRQPRLGAELLTVIGTGGRWDDGRRFCAAHGIETREVE